MQTHIAMVKTMTRPPFAVGDRVRIRKSSWRAGLKGTIQRVYLSLADTYEVWFDGEPISHIVHGQLLEPLLTADDQPRHTVEHT
jgi:hypothetical protein